jgi:hypothetical protein
MEIELIEESQHKVWDKAIAPFESRVLYHQSAWLAFLEESRSAKLLRFRIIEGGDTLGYFPGLLIKKGPFHILGSPLTGWQTDYIGPIINRGLCLEDFLRSLDDLCRQWRIHHVQIGNPVLNPAIMRKMGFNMLEWRIFSIPIYSDHDHMWKNLNSKCRNRIRKGISNGLVVQDCDDPEFADEYYAQLIEVFARQGLSPQYSLETVQSLYRNLKRHNALFSLQVKYGEEVIATGLFPHDDHHVHSFGITCRTQYRNLCPNELLYWNVMRLAGELGIHAFNIGGIYRRPESGGSFKKKFNGREVSVQRFYKSYTTCAKLGHRAFNLLSNARQWVAGARNSAYSEDNRD